MRKTIALVETQKGNLQIGFLEYVCSCRLENLLNIHSKIRINQQGNIGYINR